MDFKSYMKAEIEKFLFIEIKEDLILNINKSQILKKGEYPIMPGELVDMAKQGMDNLTGAMLINGMIYVIACDPDFKYVKDYIETLKCIDGIESYIIMNINKSKKDNIKKSVILTSALSQIYNKKEYFYNRAVFLMSLYENTGLHFIEDEIVASLIAMTERFKNFALPNLHLGKYYLDKDTDMARLYLRRCQDDPETMTEARELMNAIDNVQRYDDGVEYVKNGQGLEALEILIPISNDNPDNLDAKYYMAMAYRQIGNNQKALMYLNELTNFAERAEVYSEIALNLAELDDFVGAMEYLKKALKIQPDDTGIICNMGVCNLNLSRLDDARKAFELVLRINPKDEIAAQWIARMNK